MMKSLSLHISINEVLNSLEKVIMQGCVEGSQEAVGSHLEPVLVFRHILQIANLPSRMLVIHFMSLYNPVQDRQR